MRPLLTAAFLLIALNARAADALDGVDFSTLRARSAAAAAPAGTPAASPASMPASPSQPPAAHPAGKGIDMGPFLRRLEDLGFKTDTVRVVLGRITVAFGAPSGSANAEWKYIRGILQIPDSFKQPGTNSIRADLAPNEVATVIHELTHAANSVLADKTAAKGTPAFEHWDAVYTIWADLRGSAYFYRYGGFKADEVSGYFMGDAYSEVFGAIVEIVTYNTTAPAPAGVPIDDVLRLPTAQDATNEWQKTLAASARQPFGKVSVVDSASFEGNLIGWEERPMTKDQMYKHILGLNPPKDRIELLARLNASQSEWARALKQRTRETRLRLARPR